MEVNIPIDSNPYLGLLSTYRIKRRKYMEKAPYTKMIAHNMVTGENIYGVISNDCVTLRIDVCDSLENWVAIENDKPNPCRPLTWT